MVARQKQAVKDEQTRENQKRYLAEKAEHDRQWRTEYDAYLASPEWARRRAAVLEREGYLCEGCRKQRATQVHHTHYRSVRDELLFELHALCRDCHERITERNGQGVKFL